MNFCKCGNKISKKEYIRCRVCYIKKYSRKGKKSNLYIDGRTSKRNKCIICDKILGTNSFRLKTKKCKSCSQIGDLNPINRSENKEKFSIFMSKLHKGKTISKEMRKKLSKINSGRNNNMFGKISHSKGKYYGKIWMRSSWEIAYAKWLDKQNIKWLYEPKAFDLGESTYRPDFYLPEIDTYIEIKGYWRDDAKKKFILCNKLYPKIKIRILNERSLKILRIL